MKENLTEDQISHPLNESLLKEASEIKEERELLKKRLEKLDENREGVSPSVYQKVRSDYLLKLNQTAERMLTLKKELEKEQKILLQKKNSVDVAMKSCQEAIEESGLRHALGEYVAAEHQQVLSEKNAELKRLGTALKTLDEGLSRHRKLFEGEALEVPTSPQAVPVETTSRVKLDREPTDKVEPPPVTASKTVPEIHLYENGKVTQKIPIDRTIHIGRSPSNEITLKEPKVSRKHAEIQCVGGKYVILDLESSNGTFVAGKKVTEQVLQPGDEIIIGNAKMIFKA